MPGISDYNGVLLVVEWDGIGRKQKLKEESRCTNRRFRLASLSTGKARSTGWKWQLRRGDMEKLQGYNFRVYQTLCTSKNSE